MARELDWISVKVTPEFKEKLRQKSVDQDPLGIGNVSDVVRRACQSYLAGDSSENEDLNFLYNLMENKFRLKANLTDIEKKRLQKIEGALSG